MKEAQKEISLASGEVLEMKELVTMLHEWGANRFASFLVNEGIRFPRADRMSVLREVLRPGIVKTRNESLTLDSRLNYRLLWFNIFSEEQLVFFIDTFDTKYLAWQYEKNLYEEIVFALASGYKETLEILVQELKEFENADGSEELSMREFHNLFNEIFVDEEGEVDGLSTEEFRPIMYNSATVIQLNAIASKFGFEVPQSLKKDVLPSYITTVIKSVDPEADVQVEMFDNMTVKEMKDFALKYGFEVGSSLNKKQVIEYILMNCETTKNAYVLPESDAVYEMAIPITEAESKFDELVLERDRILNEIIILQERLHSVDGNEKAKIADELAEKETMLATQDETLAQAKEEIEKAKNEKDAANKSLEEAMLEIERLKKELLFAKQNDGSFVYVEKEKGGCGCASDESLDELRNRLNYLEQLFLTREKMPAPTQENEEDAESEVEFYEHRPISRALKIGIFFSSLVGFGLCVFGVIMLALLLAGVIG